jgi:DNA primase
MASIPQDKVQEIRDRLDIERVIGRTVQLKRQGNRLTGLCPFHSEKSPSLSVDPQKKLFHCFGCHAGGDAFDFIMRMESVEFVEAARMLAREFGVDLPEREESPEEKRARNTRERIFRANDLAARFYAKTLGSEPRALAYLREERRLSDETIRSWRLGWAPDVWSAMSEALGKEGVPEDVLVLAGLSARRREGHGVYDRLRGRVVFPIALPGGDTAGFGARRADWFGAEGEDRGPKYLNSPETPVYDKSSIFFGLEKAKDPIRRQKRALMVEGYLDVIALHQAGVDTAIACCGTALSGKHSAQLARMAEEVVTIYDGDPAGAQATRRAAEILLAAGVSVRVVSLPEGEDPDTFVQKHGGPTLERLIREAPSAIDHVVELAAKQNSGGGLAGLVKIVEEVRPLLLAVKDPLRRDVFIQGAARRLKIDARVLSQHLRRPDEALRAPDRELRGQRPQGGNVKEDAVPGIEAAMLRMLVENPERVATAVEAKGAVDAFCHPAVKAAVAAGVQAVKAHQPFDAHRALEAVRASGASDGTIRSLRETLVNSPPGADDVEESLKNLLRREYERRLRDLRKRLALEQDPAAADRLSAEVAEVVRAKASLH